MGNNACNSVDQKQKTIDTHSNASNSDVKSNSDHHNYLKKAISLCYLGRYAESIREYDAAIKCKSDNPHAYYNKGTHASL